MARKLMVVLSLMLALSFFAVAEGSQESAPADQVEITFWYFFGGEEGEFVRSTIEKFHQSQTGITVEGTEVGWQNMEEKLQVAITSGNPPDVGHGWFSTLSSWAPEGLMTPLTEYAEADAVDERDWIPVAWDALHWNDELYALSDMINTSGFYYNNDLLKLAGLDGPAETIDELRDYMEALTVRDSDGKISQLGYVPWDVSLLEWGVPWGGSFYDEETRQLSINDPEYVEILEWWMDTAQQYGRDDILEFMQSYAGSGVRPDHPFHRGKLAITYVGSWFGGWISRYAPDMDWFVAAPPRPDGGTIGTFGELGSLYFIPTGASNTDAGWELIKFLTSYENAGDFGAFIGNITPYNTVNQSRDFLEQMPTFEHNGIVFSEMAETNLVHTPLMPAFGEFRDNLRTAQDSVLFGEKEPQEALDELNESMQEVIDSKF